MYSLVSPPSETSQRSTAVLVFCLSAAATAALLLLAQMMSAVVPLHANARPSEVMTQTASRSLVGPSHLAMQTSRRQAGALLMSTIGAAMAAGPSTAAQQMAQLAEEAEVVPVWLGSGCFWGRQYDFVELEKKAFGRNDALVTSLSGYAGGTKVGPGGLNCYFGGPKGTLYEQNGQAEVVQVLLDRGALEDQFRAAIRVYFRQFNRLPNGWMIRQDPQDLGPAYRSVLGLPGGINSPLMDIVHEENINRMDLREGLGDDRDLLNVVWVMDTSKFPFFRAERYHQFHRGLGRENFGRDYLVDLREVQNNLGRIAPTGCPDI